MGRILPDAADRRGAFLQAPAQRPNSQGMRQLLPGPVRPPPNTSAPAPRLSGLHLIARRVQEFSKISMRGGLVTPPWSIAAFKSGSLANASACPSVGKS